MVRFSGFFSGRGVYLRKKFLFAILYLIGSVLISPAYPIYSSHCYAQDIAKQSLINSAARERADRAAPQKSQSLRQSKKGRAIKFSPRRELNGSDLGDALELDTVENIVASAEYSSSNYLNSSKSFLYFKYFDELSGAVNADDFDTRPAAEKMLMYYGLDSIADYIVTSPLAETYKRFRRYFRKYDDMTTVQVSQRGAGNIDVGNGEKASTAGRLLEFKVHTSIREGIEPRLRISDHFLLRYDIMDSQAMFEYNLNF